jgi:hypothetical protein
MFPVLFFDNMACAAEALLALIAVFAAGVNFMYFPRA